MTSRKSRVFTQIRTASSLYRRVALHQAALIRPARPANVAVPPRSPPYIEMIHRSASRMSVSSCRGKDRASSRLRLFTPWHFDFPSRHGVHNFTNVRPRSRPTHHDAFRHHRQSGRPCWKQKHQDERTVENTVSTVSTVPRL
jgi:hypothetical protein